MSRIGLKPITIPENVTYLNENNHVTVTGPKGTLSKKFTNSVTFEVVDNVISLQRKSNIKTDKQLHGTSRALLNGMVEGVTVGFKKTLELVGIGYKASMQSDKLQLNVGYSHPVIFTPLAGVKIEITSPTEIVVSGIDKYAVGQQAALIREVRKPEPYKGKGIRYKGEVIRRKEGKKAGK